MSAQDYKNKGNKAFAEGNFIQAINDFTTAISLEDNYVFFSNRSGAYASLKQWDNALNDANDCIKRNPGWGKGYSRKGTALFGKGDIDGAISAYEEGLKVEPNNASLQEGLQEAKKAKNARSNPFGGANPFGPGGNPFEYGPKMLEKLRNNPTTRPYLDDPSFVAKLSQLGTPNGSKDMLQDPRMLQVMGVLLGMDLSKMPQQPMGNDKAFDMKDDDEEDEPIVSPARPSMPKVEEPKKEEVVEEEYIDEELEAEKREKARIRAEADAEKELGTVAYKKRDFETAIKHYKKAFEIDDSNPVYLMNLSAVYFEQNKYEDCIEECNKALKFPKIDYKQKAKVLLRQANSYMKLNKFAEAIQSYKHSILEDNTSQARDGLKKAEAEKKKFDELSYIDPEKSEEAKQAGNAAFKDGKYAEAIEFYTDALKRNPDNYVVYSNRAACYTKLMQWDKGLEDCNKCIAKDPKFVKAYIRKGKIQHFLKQYHQALDSYKIGLELEPNSSEILEGIQQTRQAIARDNASGQVDEQRMAQAMADPEIQGILRDPMMNQVLQDLQTDPAAGQKYLSNPDIVSRLEKLAAAGIIRLG